MFSVSSEYGSLPLPSSQVSPIAKGTAASAGWSGLTVGLSQLLRNDRTFDYPEALPENSEPDRIVPRHSAHAPAQSEVPWQRTGRVIRA
jgi:hypothetical protein